MIDGVECVLVRPGEVVGVEEEFYPGEGVYVGRDGFLRSGSVGMLVLDRESKVVNVKVLKKPLLPRPGLNVVGIVSSIRHDMVFVELYGAIALGSTVSWIGEFTGVFTGTISISQVSGGFVRDISEYYRVGDVVIARVLGFTSPYQLSTRAPQHGVVYSLCSNCLTPLEPVNQRAMRCPRCGSMEARKVSILASSKILQLDIKRLLAVKRW